MSVSLPLPRINRRLLLFAVTTVVTLWLLYRAGGVLLPFVLGLGFAYFVAPLVERIDRLIRPRLARWRMERAARPLAIVTLYLLIGGTLAVVAVTLVPPLVDQLVALGEAAPELLDLAETRVDEAIVTYERWIPAEAQAMIEEAASGERIEGLVVQGLDILRRGVFATLAAASSTVGFLLASLVIPFWLFYILNDTGRVLRGVLGLVPSDVRPDVEAGRVIVERVLAGYIRGQAIIALVLGVIYTVVLWALDVPYALVLGALAGALAIIPFVGSIIGAIPPLVVAGLQSSQMALAVLVAIVVIQQVDNIFISPRVQGDSVRLNPGIIMVVIVVGQALLGPIGFLVSVPLAAIVRDLVHYAYLRVGEEEIMPVAALEAVGYGEAVTEVVRGAAV